MYVGDIKKQMADFSPAEQSNFEQVLDLENLGE